MATLSESDDMSYENINFKEGTKFLVTGGAGFIGSNLCEILLKKGYHVVCLDDLSTGSIENVKIFKSYPNYQFIEGDIRNYDTCLDACKEIDYVLHQAAWGSVPRSMKKPLLYEEINVKGTLNMLEAAKQSNVKKFVYASSSSVYGDDKSLPKKEGREGTPISPYALTKKINEDYAKLYSDVYGLETIGLRYFNVFGKRQNPDGPYAAVIPKFISKLLNDERPTIYGDGKQSRDFTYIDNVVQANLKACQTKSDISGDAYNIACNDSYQLHDLIQHLKISLNKEEIKPYYETRREGDVKHSLADIEKAKLELGYNPDIIFFKGIEKTLEWYVKKVK